jgi:type I restriction enzyme S subunit
MIEGLKPYPKMKDSGLPWCPHVPAHWDLVPNRAFLNQRKVLVGEKHSDYTLLSLTKQGVIVRDISENKGKFSADMGTSQEVRKGNLVMCLFDVPETPRTIGLSRHTGMITSAYTVFEVRDDQAANWLEAFYISMDDRKLLSPLYSGLRHTIPKTRFLSTHTPLPAANERAAIIRFLTHADGRIRQLIRSKQRLVALLEEQKHTIIHHAVTRGLDQNVRLMPTGQEWIGDVPAHWDLVPNRAYLRLKKEVVGKRSGDYVLLSLTKRGIIARDMENPEGKFPTSFDTYQVIEPGDFVFCLFDIDETPRAVGLSTLHGMITGAYTRFACDPSIAEWVYLFYLAMDNGKRLKPLYTGLRKVITKSRFLGAKIPMPPPEERIRLVAEVEHATRGATDAISRAQREIDLLKEFRTRLISDVVTGRLDVRDAAARLPAEDLEGDDPLDDTDTDGEEDDDSPIESDAEDGDGG